jgi:hypothetical protein
VYKAIVGYAIIIDASHDTLHSILESAGALNLSQTHLGTRIVHHSMALGAHFFGPLLGLLCPGALQLLPGQFVEPLPGLPLGPILPEVDPP